MSTGPTLTGFSTFIRDVMAIDPLYLPDDAPVIDYAYNAALSIVSPSLAAVGCAPSQQWSIYAVAIYNLGGSNLINYAQDQPGRTYFTDQRAAFGITNARGLIRGFVPGVVASAADETTSVSLLNPEFMKTLTLGNLRNLKDPWGRHYLELAQDLGPLWGIS